MSTESHPSPTGSSSSLLFGGGGSAGANEHLTQPSPAKPTWAQILNSNPPISSTGNHTSSSSSSSSQHSAPPTLNTKTKAISPSTTGGAFNVNPTSRPTPMGNFYEQQQQSQMNWSLNFNQSSPWPLDDASPRHSNLPTNSSQQSLDNDRTTPAGGGDGFDRLEASSPTSEWTKPVSSTNSTANGWSNFPKQQQQQHPMSNPSRANPNSNQWLDMNNFYGGNTPTSSSNTGSFNFSQHNNNDTSSSSNTWQAPPTSSATATDTLSSSSHTSVMNKHKSSSTTSSISGALKSNIALTVAGVDLISGSQDAMIPYVPQPKLVEQLGWDEPDIQVAKRPHFDDGTSIWGDPMDSVAVPVKKWTNGTKGALTNATNTIQQQQPTPPPSLPATATIPVTQPMTQKPLSTGNSSTQMVLNDENWPKQLSPTLGQPPSSQWNDPSTASNLDQSNLSQQQQQQQPSYRNQPNNWNMQSQQHSSNQSSDDWFREGMVDTSGWGLQGPQHKIPFDPYEGQVDTSGWGVQGAGGMPGPMPAMARNRFMTDFSLNENLHDPHHSRMPPYESQPFSDPYRQNPDSKNPMMGLGNILPLSSNMPPNQHSFVPRSGPLYPPPPDNILRSANHNGGGLSTPPGAIMNQGNLLSPKLPTSSPVPTQPPYVPMPGKSTNIPNHSSQTPTPSQQQQHQQQQQQQQHISGNGNNPNGNNSGAVHAQIMQQFRLAVQAGLISQDLLNTKLPPYMLQLLQKLFELQQKFQNYSGQLSELNKQKAGFPLTVFQNECDRLSKSTALKKQEMLTVQKEIQDAHTKLKQQSNNSSSAQMMNNAQNTQNLSAINPDQSRLHQWTKQANPTGQRTGMFPPPPGLTRKDWQTDNHDSNDNWDQSQTNESNNHNQIGNVDSQMHHHHHHHHHHQGSSSTFPDPFSNIVDDIDGPPPFIPGQLWNWKSSGPNAEDDPHVTPSSFIMGPKGLSSPMGNLNVGGADSAFSNPSLMHQYPRHQQSTRSQWQQGSLHDQQGFPSPMNDWNKQPQQQQQYRGTSKPPHQSFGGGYRPYT